MKAKNKEKYFFAGAVAEALIEKNNKILFIKRGHEPFKGFYGLPAGFVEKNETVEEAAVREAKEETGLRIRLKEILGVYSDPRRDPRGRVVSTIFISEIIGGKLKAGSDASSAIWIDVRKIPFKKLSFDYGKTIKDYLKWRKNKGTYWSKKK
jgi:8-oxo-dGTP diphosphatase